MTPCTSNAPRLAPRELALIGPNVLFENLERFICDDVLRMPTDSSQCRNGLGLLYTANLISAINLVWSPTDPVRGQDSGATFISPITL